MKKDSRSGVDFVLVACAFVCVVGSLACFARMTHMKMVYQQGANSVSVLGDYSDPSNTLLQAMVSQCVDKDAATYSHGVKNLLHSTHAAHMLGQKSYKTCYNQHINWAQRTVLLPLL